MAERTTELRHDIEDTRQRMTGTVDAIGDRVSPGRVAERRWARVRASTTRAKERVMGSPGSAGGPRSSDPGGLTGAASSAASTVRDGVSHAPDRIEQGTRGNPLAAGAVAFGVGVLVGSLAPATKEEAELVDQALEPLQAEARAIGQEVAADGQGRGPGGGGGDQGRRHRGGRGGQGRGPGQCRAGGRPRPAGSPGGLLRPVVRRRVEPRTAGPS